MAATNGGTAYGQQRPCTTHTHRMRPTLDTPVASLSCDAPGYGNNDPAPHTAYGPRYDVRHAGAAQCRTVSDAVTGTLGGAYRASAVHVVACGGVHPQHHLGH